MSDSVDILILGAGWLSTFLIPLCLERGIAYAATTQDGRNNTLPFAFDPTSNDIKPFSSLPDAQTVLITFPISDIGGAKKLVTMYRESRNSESPEQSPPRFIQLGTTSIWELPVGSTFAWFDRNSSYTPKPRAMLEQELLALSPSVPTTVLNLAGLWGGSISVRNWVWKVAGTKDVLREKGSLHLIHGLDVSRAILAVHSNFSKTVGQRWILTDGRVYDWWDLASAWGSMSRSPNVQATNEESAPEISVDKGDLGPQARWVRELMHENKVRALPRNVELLGRALDSRGFWETFELSPLEARVT